MKRLTWLEVIVVISLLTITIELVYTRTMSIARLPSNARADRVEWIDPDGKNLTETVTDECNITTLLKRAALCRECITTLLRTGFSPDCCLEVASDPYEKNLKCTEDDDSRYAPWARAFDCPAADMIDPDDYDAFENCDYHNVTLPTGIVPSLGSIDGAQKRGCPNATPDNTTSTNLNAECIAADSDWYCTDLDILPQFRGCAPLIAISDYDSDFPTSNDPVTFYQDPTTDIGGGCPVVFSGNVTECYEYIPIPGFTGYITACEAHTKDYERYKKEVYCCQRNVCCERDSKGTPTQCCPNDPDVSCPASFQKNCNTVFCDRRSIDQADNWDDEIGTIKDLVTGQNRCCGTIGAAKNASIPTDTQNDCFRNPLDSGLCAQIEVLAEACLAGEETDYDCTGCYDDIVDTFFYEFVPKSNEALAIFWEITSTPSGVGDPGQTYFFTRVIISEVEDDGSDGITRDDLTSMLHQRDFINAWSIFAGTVIEAGKLFAGRTYRIRLQYFIPNDGDVTTKLGMLVTSMRLFVTRTRE